MKMAISENSAQSLNFGFGPVMQNERPVEIRIKMSIRSLENPLLRALINVVRN